MRIAATSDRMRTQPALCSASSLFALTFTLGSLSWTASCAVTDGEPEVASEAAAELTVPHGLLRASVLAADELLAASIATAGEADGLWPWLTDDAAYLHPGVDVISGQGAARAFLRGTYPDRTAQAMTLHRISGDVSADAHLGYTFGWFDEVAGGVTSYGKYIAAWTRGAGPWRLAAFARVVGSRAPSPTPTDAEIVDGEHGVPRPGDPAAIRDEAIAADAAFAAMSATLGYTVAFTTYCADAAVVLAGSDFFWNDEGVAYAWSGWSPAESLEWTPLLGGGAGSGDLAYTVGNGTFSFFDGPEVQRFYSKYLTIWVREASGEWRWLLDGGNSRPAPAAP